MAYANLRVDREGGLAIVSLHRPPLNALNGETLRELRDALSSLARDPAVRVVLLTGGGEKAFAAGADIKEMAGLDPLGAREFARLGQEVCNELERMEKPTIAVINGYALGGGCELALACDIRLAAEGALLGQPEVNLGIPPGFGGTQRLLRLVGRGRASELIFTGRQVEAQEAASLGLVNRVAPRDGLLDEARELARTIMEKGPLGVALAKAALHQAEETGISQGLAFEAEAFSHAFSTEDQKEGMRAFLEKRKAQFKGR